MQLRAKIHLACEQGRKPLALVFTAGQRADSPQFTTVLAQIRVPRPGPGRPRSRPERVLAVKVDQAANRAKKGTRGGRPPTFDPDTYRDGHAVECGTNLLKHHRAVATPYDELLVRYAATVHIAAIDIWLRALARTTS